ncbi:uncharacterized protein LOC132198618 isoform X2 [Neocloeon triangulifer]|nr:uncharacterized protein LOC132198618 isoform X2 [Neocloeon triangulifer]
MMNTHEKSLVAQQGPKDSESGFSEYSSATAGIIATMNSPPSINLQNFLQSWKPDEPELLTPLCHLSTLVINVNGVEIPGLFTLEDASKLKSALEGTSKSLPCMPLIGGEPTPMEQCESWVQSLPNHVPVNEYETTENEIAPPNIKLPETATNLKCKHSPKTRPVNTMIERLKPKLPSEARLSLPMDMDDHNIPSQRASSPLSDESSEKEPAPIPNFLALDLELSSESSDEEESQPVVPAKPPVEGVTLLDGLKLTINCKAIRAAKSNKRKRSSSSNSSSTSMDEEDLPLLDDAFMSNDDLDLSPEEDFEVGSSSDVEMVLLPSSKNEKAMVVHLPKREPRALEEEEMIKQERKYMQAYDTWLELRKLQYAKFIPEVVRKMPSNMQPVVRLERRRSIDELAKEISLDSSDQCYQESQAPVMISIESSAEDSSNPSLIVEAEFEAEETLFSLLDNLENFSFSGSTQSQDFPNVCVSSEIKEMSGEANKEPDNIQAYDIVSEIIRASSDITPMPITCEDQNEVPAVSNEPREATNEMPALKKFKITEGVESVEKASGEIEQNHNLIIKKSQDTATATNDQQPKSCEECEDKAVELEETAMQTGIVQESCMEEEELTHEDDSDQDEDCIHLQLSEDEMEF